MGTWDDGILDNDTALDGLGDLAHGIVLDLAALGRAEPSARAAGRLAAGIGILLQMSAYALSPESPSHASILAALAAQASSIAKLSPRARALLRDIAEGRGPARGERPAKIGKRLARRLHTSGRSGLGKREPALFETPAGAAYVRELARRVVEGVESDLEDEENWSDLCREGMGVGGLALLLVLDPCRVSVAKIRRFRRCAAKGIAALEARADDELEFHRGYYANLDGVLAALEKRFGGSVEP